MGGGGGGGGIEHKLYVQSKNAQKLYVQSKNAQKLYVQSKNAQQFTQAISGLILSPKSMWGSSSSLPKQFQGSSNIDFVSFSL